MATPRPISATRNCTISETSVTRASPPMNRKLTGIAIAAMTSGTSARNDANTNASTIRAPRAPNTVSASTPGPPPPPPPVANSVCPVTLKCAPAMGCEASQDLISGVCLEFPLSPGTKLVNTRA